VHQRPPARFSRSRTTARVRHAALNPGEPRGAQWSPGGRLRRYYALRPAQRAGGGGRERSRSSARRARGCVKEGVSAGTAARIEALGARGDGFERGGGLYVNGQNAAAPPTPSTWRGGSATRSSKKRAVNGARLTTTPRAQGDLERRDLAKSSAISCDCSADRRKWQLAPQHERPVARTREPAEV